MYYWRVLCVVCITFHIQSGRTLDTRAFTEYENGIRQIVSEFLSDVNKTHSDNQGHKDEITSPTRLQENNGNASSVVEETRPIHNDTHQASSAHNGVLFSKFPCSRVAPSKRKPNSVHELRAADIDIVAAIGDSLTAGKAAGSKGVAAVLFDYRGLSWSIGGDGTFDTLHSLPNILREYNPDLYGFSNSIGDLMSQTARLNVAKSGATSDNLAFQAALLIQRLKNDPHVDFDDDWKVITILIGANDLCRSCKSVYTPLRYINRLQSALDILHDSLPRTFVNLVEVMPVELARFLPRDPFCKRIETYYCGCVLTPKTETHFNRVVTYRKEFQRLTEELVSSGRYDDRDDFTVVVQPFYKNFKLQMIPGTREIDYSIFAVDCFHLSMEGQSRGGLGLWNNMLQPIGQKSTDWGITESMLCPSESHPYLATAKNSKRLFGKFRGLVKHKWMKKIMTSSIKELTQRGQERVDTGIINVFRTVEGVDDHVISSDGDKDDRRNKQFNDVITQTNASFRSFHTHSTESSGNNNSSSGTSGNWTEVVDVVVELFQDQPEPWEIWSMVLGWTLLMTTVLMYCVTMKNVKTREKSPLPPPVAIATIDINKH